MAKRDIKGTNRVTTEGELTPGEGIQIDKYTKYEYASELSTEGVKLVDPGGGPVNTIRVFAFKMNPNIMRHTPNKQTIFSSHAKQIEHILWGDGLRPLENVSPRVILNSKEGSYQIFVACEAAKGVLFSEKDRNPELLHKQLNRKLDPKTK